MRIILRIGIGFTLLLVVGQFDDTADEPQAMQQIILPESCVLMDTDNDGDIDLSDYAAWQACFNGPNTNDVFNILGGWDVFYYSGVWRYDGFTDFLSSGVVLLYGYNEAALYTFDGMNVSYGYDGCFSSYDAHMSLDKESANEMSGTRSCSNTSNTFYYPARAIRRP